MSRDDVELVRAAYAALNRGDMASFLGAMDPDVEWKPATHDLDPHTHAGRTGVRHYYSTRRDVWEELREEPVELIDAGESVVAVVRTHRRGRSSGVTVEEEWAHVWTVREGKVIRFEVHRDRESALAAARD